MAPTIDAQHSRAAARNRCEEERPEDGLFILPGGYIDATGARRRQVHLRALTGHEEEWIAQAPAETPTARAVTALLCRCIEGVEGVERVDPEMVGDLLIGDRDYLMLRLRQLTFGAAVDAVVHCGNPLCGKPMDIQFRLEDVPIHTVPASQRELSMELSAAAVQLEGDRPQPPTVEFRLPTGADQEALAAMAAVDAAQAADHLLARCVRRLGELTDVDAEVIAGLPTPARAEIEAAIESHAPQVDIELETTCPVCSVPTSATFDVVSLLFTEVRAAQHALEREVHVLASHYHWSERDICTMTRAKRRRYLTLLQETIERGTAW